jgi:hypothetical protein
MSQDQLGCGCGIIQERALERGGGVGSMLNFERRKRIMMLNKESNAPNTKMKQISKCFLQDAVENMG